MQLLADYASWIYFFAFILGSALVTRPWPRFIGERVRVVIPVLMVISALSIARLLNIDLESSANTLIDKTVPADGPLFEKLSSFVASVANASSLWLNLWVALLLLWAYLLLRWLSIAVVSTIALLLMLIRWVLAKLEIVKFNESVNPIQLAPGATFVQGGLLRGLVLVGIAYANLGFLQDNAFVNWYFPSLFWAGSWIALLELRSLASVVDIELDNDQLDMPVNVIGSDADSRRFRPLLKIYEEVGAEYQDQLLLAAAPESPPDSMPANSPVNKKIFDALLDLQRGSDLAFTEALSSAHIELIGRVLLSARNFGRQALILTPPEIGSILEGPLLQRFGAQYIEHSYKIHHWGEQGTPVGHVDFHFCDFDSFDYFLAHKIDVANIGLVCALELHRADLGELRFAFQRLWQRVDSPNTRKIFQSGDYYNAEPAIRYLSQTERMVEHYLTPNVMNSKFLMVWDRPKIDHGLNQRVDIRFVGEVDPAILMAKRVHDETGLATVWLDEAHRFGKDIYEELGAKYEDMPWLSRCDNRIKIDQHAHLVATEDLGNLCFARRDTGNFQKDHVYLHHIFSSNYLLRDAMADICEIEDRLWSPIMPIVEGDLDNLAHQCGQELARQNLTEQTLENLLQLFVQQDLLKELRITASLPGLQRLFSFCYGIERVDIIQKHSPRGTSIYGFSSINPDDHLIPINDTSGVLLGHCSRKDLGLLYGQQTDLYLKECAYRITGIDTRALTVSQTEASGDRRRKYLFARDYRIDNTIAVGMPVDFTQGDTRIELTRSLVHFTRTSVGFLDVPESMHLQGDENYHRLAVQHDMETTRRYKNCLRIRLSRNYGQLADIESAEFTLAALITDALRSIFPQQESHVVVLPSSRKPRPNDSYSQNTAPLFIYPQLLQDAQGKSAGGESLELVIMEDADGDLGVVSTLFQERTKILEVCQCYLGWYQQKKPENAYHHFGATQLHPTFSYEELYEYLANFTPKWSAKPANKRVTSTPRDDSVLQSTSCDFCGAGLSAGYDQLEDNRHRCVECSKNALEKIDDFRKLLNTVVERMESVYGITLTRGITAEFASARRIGEATNTTFIPSQGFDPRAVGLAIKRGDAFSILIENGAPLADSTMTIAHELTHIWQFENLAADQLNNIELVEGQARFIEIDFAKLAGYKNQAAQLVDQMQVGSDVYARGYRGIAKKIGRSRREGYFGLFEGR